MKRKLIVTSFICSSLLFSFTFADDISQLQGKIQESQNVKTQLQTQKKQVESNMASTQNKINDLNAQIQSTDTKITDTQNNINNLSYQIQQTQVDINNAEVKLNKKKEILAENVQLLYSKGNVQFLEFLFRSDSISDFLYRFNTIKDIARGNKSLYEEVRSSYDALKEKQNELQNQMNQLNGQKQQLETLKSQQSVLVQQQQDLYNQLNSQDTQITKQISDEDAAMAEINAQIGSIIKQREEERKKREEEAARQRQLQQQQQNQSNNQNSTSDSSNSGGSDLVGTGQFSLPMNPGTFHISSGFGWRGNPTASGSEFHNGIDFAAPVGTPIYAVDSGTVIYAGVASGFGHWIVIDHNNGFYSVYGHMYSNELYVSPGDQVQRGQHIADVGNDGNSTGAHLHFGLSKGSWNGYVDPSSYLGL